MSIDMILKLNNILDYGVINIRQSNFNDFIFNQIVLN